METILRDLESRDLRQKLEYEERQFREEDRQLERSRADRRRYNNLRRAQQRGRSALVT